MTDILDIAREKALERGEGLNKDCLLYTSDAADDVIDV